MAALSCCTTPAAIAQQTVEALPRILDYLQTRGDTIVPLSTLLGHDARRLDAAGRTRAAIAHPFRSAAPGFAIFHAREEFLWAFMIVATALVVLRTLIVIWLAARFRRGSRRRILAGADQRGHRCLQRGKVIAETLRAVLATDYAGADGSAWSWTMARAIRRPPKWKRSRGDDPRVRLLRQENRGKARACSAALARVQHEIVVFLDADTHCQRDTLRACSSAVCATSASARFRVTRKSATCAVSSRDARRWNTPAASISIGAPTRAGIASRLFPARSARCASRHRRVPAASASTRWPKTPISPWPCTSGDNRIVYVPDAIAWTEAPETVRTLARQRFRWAYGTLQCLWKHRDMVFNWSYRALGWFSLPSVWFFQIILVALTPHGRFFPARFAPIRRLARGAAVRRRLSRHGRDPGHARLHSGARIRFCAPGGFCRCA